MWSEFTYCMQPCLTKSVKVWECSASVKGVQGSRVVCFRFWRWCIHFFIVAIYKYYISCLFLPGPQLNFHSLGTENVTAAPLIGGVQQAGSNSRCCVDKQCLLLLLLFPSVSLLNFKYYNRAIISKWQHMKSAQTLWESAIGWQTTSPVSLSINLSVGTTLNLAGLCQFSGDTSRKQKSKTSIV